jgi:hypothetical protein
LKAPLKALLEAPLKAPSELPLTLYSGSSDQTLAAPREIPYPALAGGSLELAATIDASSDFSRANCAFAVQYSGICTHNIGDDEEALTARINNLPLGTPVSAAGLNKLT